MAVVTDIDSDARELCIEDRIAGISGSEVKLLPESGMHVRNMVLPVLAQVSAVRVDDRRGIEIKAGHLLFVHRNDHCHAVLGGNPLHQFGGGAVWDAFGQFVPANILLRAKIGSVEKFLKAKHADFFLGSLLDQLEVLLDHGLFDLRQRMIAAKRVARLDQATANDSRHGSTSERGSLYQSGILNDRPREISSASLDSVM